MSSGVWFKFRSGSQRNRHEDCFHRSRCGRFVKFSSFRLHGFRQRAILVLSEAKSKGWAKMANVHGESRSQPDIGGNSKNFGRQSSFQVKNNTLRETSSSRTSYPQVSIPVLWKHNFGLQVTYANNSVAKEIRSLTESF